MSVGRARDEEAKRTGALHYFSRKILRVQFAFRLMNQHQNLSEKVGYKKPKKRSHTRERTHTHTQFLPSFSFPVSACPDAFPSCSLMQE